ncbi:MAG: gliding motility-associated ABC transporter substrate-binding protein GldG [Bacteroidia bacterium]|nr:gliding motility-associated ABC transporter substrate-binding protein GldG [Bacteroidia bacterium]
MQRKQIKRQNVIQLTSVLLIIVLLNVIGSFAFRRFDLTAEKRFTVTPATMNYLKNLQDIVYIRVYLDGSDLPAGFKRLRNSTREMLDEFRIYARDNIQYEFIDPFASPDPKTKREIAKQLSDKGLKPTNLETAASDGKKAQQIIFPGAILSYRGKEEALDLLKNNMGSNSEENLNASAESLEYELINAIHKMIIYEKQKIAFIEGHGEIDKEHVADVSEALSEYYSVDRVRIDGKLRSLDYYKAIIIAKPDSLYDEKDKFIIDQFIMNGGKVLWLIDGVLADMDSLAYTSSVIAMINRTNLEDQLFRYGIRINPNLAEDIQCAIIPVNTALAGSQPKFSPAPWYYFPLINPSPTHAITRNLNIIKTEFVSTIDTVGDLPSVKKTILLSTSQYTRLVNAPVRISLSQINEEPSEAQYNKSHQPVAVLLEGKFESVFQNRLAPEITESKEINYLPESIPTAMVVVGDGDIIFNISRKNGSKTYHYPAGYDRYSGQMFGNHDFLINVMNYLLDDAGLMNLRTRELKLRLLDKTRTRDEKMLWQMINTLLPVAFIVLFGLLVMFFRKRKFAKSHLQNNTVQNS